MSDLFHQVELAAIRLLARREHSQLELSKKLLQRQFPLATIESVIEYCIEHNYLSDFRYAQMLFRVRASNGYGPYRIQLELKSQGVAASVIEKALVEEPIDWFDIALNRLKKYSRNKNITDYKQRSGCYRFLQGKGFDGDQIAYAFEELANI